MDKDKGLQLNDCVPDYFSTAALDIHPHLVMGVGYQGHPKFPDDVLPYDPNWKAVFHFLTCSDDRNLEKAWRDLDAMVRSKQDQQNQFVTEYGDTEASAFKFLTGREGKFKPSLFGVDLYRSLYRCFRGPSNIESLSGHQRKRDAVRLTKHLDELILEIKGTHNDIPTLSLIPEVPGIWVNLLLEKELDEFEYLPGFEPKLSLVLERYKAYLKKYSGELGTHKLVRSRPDRVTDAIRVLFALMMKYFGVSKPHIIRAFLSPLLESVFKDGYPVEISNEEYSSAIKTFKNEPERLSPII